MKTGLTKRDTDTIISILKKYPDIQLVYLFGSRATGNYKPGSDIDLAVMNTGVSEDSLNKVKNELEESAIPFFVDLINYPALQHPQLKEHINDVGIVFYN